MKIRQTKTRLYLAYLWLFISLIAAIFAVFKLKDGQGIDYNITSVFPSDEADVIGQAKDQLEEIYFRKLVFAYKAKNTEDVKKAAQALTSHLKNTSIYPLTFDEKPQESDQQDFLAHIFKYRAQLLSDKDLEHIKNNEFSILEQQVIEKIYSPFSQTSADQIQKDPLFLFYDFITQNLLPQTNIGGESFEDYTLYQKNKMTSAMISLTLTEDPFSVAVQQDIQKIYQKAQDIAQQNNVQLLRNGVVFHAAYGSDSTKGDIRKITFFSILFILLLFGVFFRSILTALTAHLIILNAMIFGFAATLLIFGQIHLFALSFATAIIGLAIDYCFHILCKKQKNETNQKAISKVTKPLILSFLTTILGYMLYFFMPIVFIRHAAVFSIFGLLAALLSCLFWMPFLPMRPLVFNDHFMDKIKHFFIIKKRPFFIGLALFYTLWIVWGLSHLKINDDIQKLQSLSPILLQEQREIADFQKSPSLSAFLLVKGQNNEEIKQHSEILQSVLDEQNIQYFSESQLFPSVKRQKENFEAIKKLYNQPLYGKILDIFNANKTDENSIFKPLTIEGLPKDNGIRRQLAHLHLNIQGQDYGLIPLFGSLDHQKLKSALKNIDYVHYSHLTKDMTSLMTFYRQSYIKIIALSIMGILAGLSLIYSPLIAVRLIAPPLISLLFAVSSLGVFQIHLTVFAMMALTLILSIGIDYSIFVYEKGKSNTTLISIILSMLSTLCAFGLLAFSQSFSIFSLGITVSFGVVSSALLTLSIISKKENKNDNAKI